MKNFVQVAETVLVTANDSTDDVGGAAGTVVQVGSLVGVACNDYVAGGQVELQLVGAFQLAKATGEIWTQGARVYWDNVAKRVTTTAAANALIGVALAIAGTNATTGLVRLSAAFTV